MPGGQNDFLLFFIPLCSVALRNPEAQLLSGSTRFLLTVVWSSMMEAACAPHQQQQRAQLSPLVSSRPLHTVSGGLHQNTDNNKKG